MIDRYEQADRNAEVDRRVLAAIRSGYAHQSEIAEHLGFYMGTVSCSLQRLVRDGHTRQTVLGWVVVESEAA